MRAGLGALEDKSPPWLGSGAPSIEVAADFTGIYRSLMGLGGGEVKTVSFVITKVLRKANLWLSFGMKTRRTPKAQRDFYRLSVSLLLLRVINSWIASRGALPSCRMAY